MNNTKIISARIPLDDYATLLSKARQANMTLSDYLISELFHKDEKWLEQAKEIEQQKAEIARLNSTLIETFKSLDTATKRIDTETLRNHKLEKLVLELKDNHNQFVEKAWQMLKSKEGIFLYSDELKEIKSNIWK